MLAHLQRLAWDWGVRCFGLSHMTNTPLRALRCGEETIELMQACRVPRALAHKLVDTVYDRPIGNVKQEIGGVLVTLSVLCEQGGLNMEQVFYDEVRRCLSKSPEEFTKRNQQKLDLGLST